MTLFGGIEAGGTKVVCIVATGPNDIRGEARFPTTTPAETIGKALDFFRTHGPVEAIGIASFGPVNLNAQSPTYGHITSTPKPGWKDTDLVGPIQSAFNVPIGFDTDVNGAALGEWQWGAAQLLDTFLYFTIGTGIGGGALVNGHMLHGLVHPEMGHILLPHDRQLDPFAGSCPYHADCFEGLASGPALLKRWGQPAESLPSDHPAWALEARYISQAMATFICTLSPQRIILGGGVMEQHQLFPLIRAGVVKALNGYVQSTTILHDSDSFIVPPALGSRAGVLGALALAQLALAPHKKVSSPPR
jgi:fructokinase